jgi:hypothetical protein
LNEGFAPPGLNKDGFAVMSMATPVVSEDDRTCRTLSRWVYSLGTGTTLGTHESNNTSARRGCDGEQVDNLVSVRVCFSRGTLTTPPACLRKRSSNEGGASRNEEWGGGVTSPPPPPPSSSSSSSSSTLSSFEDSGSEGVSFPSCPRHRPSGTLGPSSLCPRLQQFIVGMVRSPPRRLRQGNSSRGVAITLKTLRKSTSALRN